ncbi:MAG: deoxycytidylate deaminase [Patescibacteria group bacterium]|nr:deoxycytidylate deaminase [Patescibacteria group bacterium]
MSKQGNSTTVILAYVPVLHEGYRRFFERHQEARSLYLLGTGVTAEYKALTKDIRALDPALVAESLAAWKRFDRIEVADEAALKELAASGAKIVMPDEEVMRDIRDRLFSRADVELDRIFLRWDKHKSFENRPVEADQTVSADRGDQEMIRLLKKEAEKSSDIWRQIGAAIVKDGAVLDMLHNHAVPSEHMPYVEGDPRSDFSKGVNIELSTSFHAEARLIAEAARRGQSLEGASMYATTFPCPACAKLIAYSGIKKLYYADGYGVLDGERILKSRGVEIVFVKAGDGDNKSPAS